jgi:hypothetical protein
MIGGAVGGGGKQGVVGLRFDDIRCKKCSDAKRTTGSMQHTGSCNRNSKHSPAVAEGKSAYHLANELVTPREIMCFMASQICCDGDVSVSANFEEAMLKYINTYYKLTPEQKLAFKVQQSPDLNHHL